MFWDYSYGGTGFGFWMSSIGNTFIPTGNSASPFEINIIALKIVINCVYLNRISDFCGFCSQRFDRNLLRERNENRSKNSFKVSGV